MFFLRTLLMVIFVLFNTNSFATSLNDFKWCKRKFLSNHYQPYALKKDNKRANCGNDYNEVNLDEIALYYSANKQKLCVVTNGNVNEDNLPYFLVRQEFNINCQDSIDLNKKISNYLSSKDKLITTASNQTKDPSKRPLAYLSEISVCYNATTTSGGKKVWNDRNGNFVGEAKYRGLDCGVNNVNVQSKFTSTDKNKLKRFYSNVTDKKLCYQFKLNNHYKKHVKSASEIIISEEVKRRGLNCNLQDNNKTVTASKPKNTKPSISSAELEKEKQKRIALQRKANEEERKRKALEQRIAELEKKNKELQQPKQIKQKSSNEIGSGFYVSNLRHVVTNQHVIDKCNKITVGYNNSSQIKADLVASDKRNDLAILQTSSMEMASAEEKSFLQKLKMIMPNIVSKGLMRLEDVSGGEEIFVAGFPLGTSISDEMKLDNGIVRATKGMDNDVTQFIISSDIQKGNSGGPIYDKTGNIVGMAVSRFVNKNDKINFAIKGSTIKQFLSANDIPTKWANKKEEMDTKDIYQLASKQTVMVVCHN